MFFTEKFLSRLGGLVGFTISFSFGIWLYGSHAEQNIASWMMWTSLDAVSLALAIQAGNKEGAWLLAGWTIAATLVTGILLFTLPAWNWGTVETISLIGVVVASIFWLKNDSTKGLCACAVAMWVAGVPMLYTFWQHPDTTTWWLWTGTAIACLLSTLGSPKIDLKHTVIPFAGMSYQIAVLLVMFRVVH